MRLAKWFWCDVMGSHEWTSDIMERGGKADPKRLIEHGLMEAIVMDARMYCKRCGKESEMNRKLDGVRKKIKSTVVPAANG